MKSLFKLNFLVALTCLVVLGSCSSDDDTDPPKTDAELIGSGITWKFSKVTAAGIDASAFIDACHLDNLITFNFQTNLKTGVVDSGATKCDSSSPQTEDFTWDYNESTKILSVNSDVIDIPGASGDLKVVSVTSIELVLSQNVSIPNFGIQEVKLTLVH
ncbi:lipocalin family protein [Algoriphagus aquimarinus]|uniref:lipocalin family protein n=1 Tax=Algoriphagus aquimarinus TaxID=237018 RepID=UPI0030DCEAB7|tara:strand:- start:1267 stop:1743 length:477 start_codon:yes stop_codon:yes gene_type:complete